MIFQFSVLEHLKGYTCMLCYIRLKITMIISFQYIHVDWYITYNEVK